MRVLKVCVCVYVSLSVSLRTMINWIPIVRYPHFWCYRYSHTITKPLAISKSVTTRSDSSTNKQKVLFTLFIWWFYGQNQGCSRWVRSHVEPLIQKVYIVTQAHKRTHSRCYCLLSQPTFYFAINKQANQTRPTKNRWKPFAILNVMSAARTPRTPHTHTHTQLPASQATLWAPSQVRAESFFTFWNVLDSYGPNMLSQINFEISATQLRRLKNINARNKRAAHQIVFNYIAVAHQFCFVLEWNPSASAQFDRLPAHFWSYRALTYLSANDSGEHNRETEIECVCCVCAPLSLAPIHWKHKL